MQQQEKIIGGAYNDSQVQSRSTPQTKEKSWEAFLSKACAQTSYDIMTMTLARAMTDRELQISLKTQNYVDSDGIHD